MGRGSRPSSHYRGDDSECAHCLRESVGRIAGSWAVEWYAVRSARKLPVLDACVAGSRKLLGPGSLTLPLWMMMATFCAAEVLSKPKYAPKLSCPVTFTGPRLKFDVSSVVSPNAYTVKPRWFPSGQK